MPLVLWPVCVCAGWTRAATTMTTAAAGHAPAARKSGWPPDWQGVEARAQSVAWSRATGLEFERCEFQHAAAADNQAREQEEKKEKEVSADRERQNTGCARPPAERSLK